MATAGSILGYIRVLLGDPDQDFVSDTIGLDWLNEAQRRFCHNVLALDEYKDYPIVAKKLRYDFPTDCITPIGVMWYQSRVTKLGYRPPDTWSYQEEAFPNSTGTPDYYTVIRRQVVIGPNVPTTNSATALASGAIQASNTTLGFTAASGNFRTKGFLQIASGTSVEIVEFGGVATTTVTNVTRGVHNTTAASFGSGASITQIDLQMLYRKSPAIMTASTSSPDIPEAYHDYLTKYALYLGWLSRGDQSKADRAFVEFESLEKDTKKTIGRRSQDGVMRIQDKRNRWYAGW